MDGDVSYVCANPSLTFITAFINKIPTQILIDTGASRSFIRESTLKNCRLRMSKQKNYLFRLADGTTSFSTIGEIQLYIKINDITTTILALVVRNLSCDCILGMVFDNQEYVVNWIQFTMGRIEWLTAYHQIHMS